MSSVQAMFSIKIIDLERKVNINLINEVSIPHFPAGPANGWR